jgi:biopolymer transport protein ExbD
MPLKTAESIEEPNINLTPMIDIVFLLVIFFMVGTQFSELERQYDIQLPSVSDAQPLTSRPDEIVINVGGDGSVIINGQTRTLTQLEAELIAARQNYPDQAVIVRGEGGGPYQHVMDVLAICHRAKITSISLANRLEGEGEK